MAKNPICPIYYNDLLNSTKDWNDEEFGAYCRLLFHQWDKGSIPEEMSRLSRIAESAKRNWKLLSSKFLKTDEGLKNPVMENYRETREKFTKRQQENVLKRYQNGYQNSTKLPTKHIDKSLPLENEDENEEGKGGVGEKPELWTDIVKYFFQDFNWKEKFCRDRRITQDFLESKMKRFIALTELREDFKELKEIKRHFTNWFIKHPEPERENTVEGINPRFKNINNLS